MGDLQCIRKLGNRPRSNCQPLVKPEGTPLSAFASGKEEEINSRKIFIDFGPNTQSYGGWTSRYSSSVIVLSDPVIVLLQLCRVKTDNNMNVAPIQATDIQAVAQGFEQETLGAAEPLGAIIGVTPHQLRPNINIVVLTCKHRFNIVKGVAARLFYLHEEWEHVVVHQVQQHPK
nr:probable L-type lectin-domain containing receptor kinase VI.1 [Ipomoea batatas]